MLNFVGNPQQVLLRENIKIYDNNAFITLWITVLQLEAALLPGGPQLNEEQLSVTLEAIATYHDRNRPKGSSIIVYWPQRFSKEYGMWYSYPDNFGPMISDDITFTKVFSAVLDDLGLKNYSANVTEYNQFM